MPFAFSWMVGVALTGNGTFEFIEFKCKTRFTPPPSATYLAVIVISYICQYHNIFSMAVKCLELPSCDFGLIVLMEMGAIHKILCRSRK